MAIVFESASATRDLAALLAAVPSGESPQTIAANSALIREIGAHDRVISVIDELLASEGPLSTVAARSYRHVNLFDKIVLVGNDDPAAYRLTFHLWSPPYTDPELRQELIHEHRFDFWSTVLTGTLRSEIFTKDNVGKSYRRFRYVPEVARTQQFQDFYEFCGEQRLLSLGVHEKGPGTAYYLSAPLIHRIIPPTDQIVCTLVLRGPRLRSYSFVYNTAYPSTDTNMTNTMFTPEQLARKLTTLRAALQRDAPNPPVVGSA